MILTSALSARPAALRAVAGILLMGLLGCEASKSVVAPASSPPPVADSPVHALALMKWSWEARDLSQYSTLLPANFGGGSFVTDTVGNLYRTKPWTRDDEVVYAGNLFRTATAIRLDFTRRLVPAYDFRPGMRYPWHQVIQAPMSLAVTTSAGTTQSNGASLFYLVRGDSAALTPVMIASGMPADSNRWYIEHWENQLNTRPGPP
jgi:hypothetical protein